MALTKIKSSNITTDTIVADDIASGGVGAAELAGTLNLSTKTITLPAASVTPHVPAAPVTSVNGATGVVTVSTGVDGIVSTANATAITIDSSENVGIGVTPTTWDSEYSILQIGNAGAVAYDSTSKNISISSNWRQSSGYKYIVTDYATQYLQDDGKHTFNVAASGTAGATFSWTTAMAIDNSGRVTVPNQPSLMVAVTSWHSTDHALLGTPTVDIGNNYNSTTGRFTAPIAGVYCFDFSLTSNDTSSHFGNIKVNGAVAGGNQLSYGVVFQNVSTSVIVSLAVGDYVQGCRRGTAYAVYHAFLCGHLLG